ncbi:toll/interleukin-1 receptor domain-containing protein [Streptomyces aidingensis]|uniref:SEFIR domain-containing protein n=1 Tax=Streptomyces aidingensis TaxID=910347 RepID=A0A1I1S9C5_9ACTN|nr:toll/interleukin-1 receptor domain-containing protein [Streptomyces aidingensis]SFD42952.1 SEFIR domain-containing protein [Streptomyces aidingensis]
MHSQNQKAVRVDLTFVGEGGRKMDPMPNGVAVGAVCLRNWQIDRIDAPVDMFEGRDAYFVKINYDLDFEPGSPRMPWFEVAFAFPSGEEQGQAIVVDALPRSGTFADVPKSYVLNRYLNFVLSEDGASTYALLPAAVEKIDAFGIGGNGVRWRHVAHEETGVRPGSYAAWTVLLTPAGQREQRVEFSVRYDLATGPDDAYRPTQSPAEFYLSLTAREKPSSFVKAPLSTTVEDRSGEYHPSVFICYAHDTPEHKDYVRRFGNLLVRNGVDVRMDQWDVNRRKGWAEWALAHINAVDFVIVLASPICRKAFDGDVDGLEHPGIRSEAKIIMEKLHTCRDEWTAKVLPVVLPHELVDNIPELLQPWTTDHYEVEQLTREGIDELLRAMTGVSRHAPPPLGQLPPSVFRPEGDSEP